MGKKFTYPSKTPVFVLNIYFKLHMRYETDGSTGLIHFLGDWWCAWKRSGHKKSRLKPSFYLILSLPTAEDTVQNLWSAPIIEFPDTQEHFVELCYMAPLKHSGLNTVSATLVCVLQASISLAESHTAALGLSKCQRLLSTCQNSITFSFCLAIAPHI